LFFFTLARAFFFSHILSRTTRNEQRKKSARGLENLVEARFSLPQLTVFRASLVIVQIAHSIYATTDTNIQTTQGG